MAEEIEVGNVIELNNGERQTVPPTVEAPNGDEEANRAKVLRVGIVGTNAVARAMNVAFDARGTDRKMVDSIKELDDLIQWRPAVTFVCTDIPLLKNDSLDDAEFINTVSRLVKQCGTGVCIRSTINIETIERLIGVLTYDVFKAKVIYNPVMTESEDAGEILTQEVEYIGGVDKTVEAHLNILKNLTNFAAVQVETGSVFEVAYAKLAVSGFKAVKQTFFNQLHEAILDVKGANPAIVRRLIQKAPDLTDRSVMIPTFIRSRADDEVSYKQAKSFGGEFLNKDVKMFVGMTDKFPLLDECVNFKNLKD
jgi:hypothetical protein